MAPKLRFGLIKRQQLEKKTIKQDITDALIALKRNQPQMTVQSMQKFWLSQKRHLS
jgi:hypothetical protein